MLKQIEGWQMWTSDAQFNVVKKELTAFIQEFQALLLKENERYRAVMSKQEREHENKTTLIRRKYLDEPIRQATKERDDTMRAIHLQWDGENGVYTLQRASRHAAERACDFLQPNGFLEKQRVKKSKAKNGPKLEEMQQSEDALREREKKIHAMINRMKQQADSILETKTALLSKRHADIVARANAEYDQQIEILRQEHINKLEQLIHQYQDEFSQYFNDQTLRTSRQSARTLMCDAKAYRDRTDIPQAMYFGERTFVISAGKSSFEPGVTGMLRAVTPGFFKLSADNMSVRVTLPYCRTLQEGYSVFMLTSNPQSERLNTLIRAYTMKVLMNFPVGQTRPLLLDSESTTTFSMFAEIGDSSKKGIVTRPWNREKDIENELQKLTAEHHQLVTSYGDDLESRLQREPIYYVACRNFPRGISEGALRDMDVVWLAGSASGFFGMVTANTDEIAKLKSRDLVESMQSHSLVLYEDHDGFRMNAGRSSDDRLSFDDLAEVMADPTDVMTVITKRFNEYKRPIERFDDLFTKDSGNTERINAKEINSWQRGNATNRCELPVGIFGARTVQKITIEGTKQHILISGVTGSGKSSLLRTMILAAMIKYDPNNVNFYLIDFKEGVEFAPLARYNLPWIKMIALNTEREFARSILRELNREFRRRAEAMARNEVSSIGKTDEESFPRIFLVFDEIQELLRINDAISEECINILSTLVSEGRAMNINVIMASQNFNICNGMDRLKANMVVRIAFAGNSESAKCIMGEDFDTSQIEQNASGFAAINTAGGAKNQTTYFQVGYLSEADRDEILKNLMQIYSTRESVTRILSRKASADINNRFNQLIINRSFTPAENADEYELMIGEFSVRRKYVRVAPQSGENILIVGNTEDQAKSMCALAVMSFLYDELAAKADVIDNELVRIVDLSDEDSETYQFFPMLQNKFSRQISCAGARQMDAMISDTYAQMKKRQRGEADAKERLLLILFGIDGAFALQQEMYDDAADGQLTTAQKLSQILKDGPTVGINSIVWARSLTALKRIIETRVINSVINKRFFYGKNTDNACEELTNVTPDETILSGAMAQYKNKFEVSTSTMRFYDLPEEQWLQRFAEVYAEFVRQKGGA